MFGFSFFFFSFLHSLGYCENESASVENLRRARNIVGFERAINAYNKNKEVSFIIQSNLLNFYTVKPGNKDPWKQRPLAYENHTWSGQSLHISCLTT